MALFHDVEENYLLNDVFFYIFSNLPRFQNMHAYRVTKETDIFEFVHTSDPAIPGRPRVPENHQVSKELVAYPDLAGQVRYGKKGILCT